jgi:hypothetical protein
MDQEQEKGAWKKNRVGIQTVLWLEPPIRERMQLMASRADRPLTKEVERAIKLWLYLHGELPEGFELPPMGRFAKELP